MKNNMRLIIRLILLRLYMEMFIILLCEEGNWYSGTSKNRKVQSPIPKDQVMKITEVIVWQDKTLSWREIIE